MERRVALAVAESGKRDLCFDKTEDEWNTLLGSVNEAVNNLSDKE